MDWERAAADTYPLLQAAYVPYTPLSHPSMRSIHRYEGVHPWRTGQAVRPDWSEREGNRFAALTSAVTDVLLMEYSKTALLSNVTWPEVLHFYCG